MNFKTITNHVWMRITLIVTVFISINLAARESNDFANGPILCNFRLLTGLPCPFCGTIRGFGLVSQGRITESLLMNPLAITLTILFFLWAFFPQKTKVIINRARQNWWGHSAQSGYFALGSIFLGMWILNLPRMI